MVGMTDYFALLQEPRRPWLDADALKQKFLARSSEIHPDRLHAASAADQRAATRRYSELNAAYLCLREPRDRVRHLLELVLGCKPEDLQEMPAELADLYLDFASVCRDADGFLARQSTVTSPLLRAQSFPEAQHWTDLLTSRQRILARRQAALLECLRTLDTSWAETGVESPAPSGLLAELGVICRQLGFFSRWNGQIQERLVRLML